MSEALYFRVMRSDRIHFSFTGGPQLHDLCHTAASHTDMSGENLLGGRLIGHRRHRTTVAYAHLADEYLVRAAEKVGCIIAKAMTGYTSKGTP